MKQPITMFTWGYWGWGRAAKQLIEATAIAEEERGFRRPYFVDIRWKRSGQAVDFVGSRFEKMLNTSKGHHYEYMQELGNKGIDTGGIEIADPTKATDLLYLADSCAKNRQRVIFYCACGNVRWDNDLNCHRDEVASLVVRQARKVKMPVEIIEWPGGEPTTIHLSATPSIFKKVLAGRATVPLTDVKPNHLKLFAGLAWGSVVTLQCDNEFTAIISGPAQYEGEWLLPVLNRKEGIVCNGGCYGGEYCEVPSRCHPQKWPDLSKIIPALQREAVQIRKFMGLNKRA